MKKTHTVNPAPFQDNGALNSVARNANSPRAKAHVVKRCWVNPFESYLIRLRHAGKTLGLSKNQLKALEKPNNIVERNIKITRDNGKNKRSVRTACSSITPAVHTKAESDIILGRIWTR